VNLLKYKQPNSEQLNINLTVDIDCGFIY